MDIINSLKLQPLPFEGGFYRETYRDSAMSCIYYLITSESFSSLHSLCSNELWHFYAGDAAQMVQISPNGELQKFILGTDLKAGHLPQIVVPSHFLQGTRLVGEGAWTLFGCTVTPAFDQSHFTMGQRCEMIKKFPHLFDTITRYSIA